MPPFKDIADNSEDERIREIGEKTMREKLVVGFITDSEKGQGGAVHQETPGALPRHSRDLSGDAAP